MKMAAQQRAADLVFRSKNAGEGRLDELEGALGTSLVGGVRGGNAVVVGGNGSGGGRDMGGQDGGGGGGERKELTMDLHGLHVDEAIDKVARVLQVLRGKGGRGRVREWRLRVITGLGLHSGSQGARLTPAVRRYFERERVRFAFDRSQGSFTVRVVSGQRV
jgi:hypothetical protein